MRKDHDRRAGGASLEVICDPCELLGAECAEAAGLELQHVDQRHEVDAGVIEAVITLVPGRLAEAVEVFRDRGVGGVVLTGHGVQLRGAQPREELLSQIEFRRLREMRDVAGVDDERRLLGQAVDDVDRAVERSGHIGIRLLVEADVAIADLHEERPAETCGALAVAGRYREIDWSEDAPGEGKECPGAAEGEALERAAARGERGWVRHVASFVG